MNIILDDVVDKVHCLEFRDCLPVWQNGRQNKERWATFPYAVRTGFGQVNALVGPVRHSISTGLVWRVRGNQLFYNVDLLFLYIARSFRLYISSFKKTSLFISSLTWKSLPNLRTKISFFNYPADSTQMWPWIRPWFDRRFMISRIIFGNIYSQN